MAMTPDEYEQMFGPGIRGDADLQEMVRFNSMSRDKVIDLNMLASSILSDAQEELVRGGAERARQYINRAKWCISQSRKAYLEVISDED